MRMRTCCTLTHVCMGMASTAWSETVRIRHAVPEDVPGILWLIQLLAEYEKEPHKPQLKKEELMRDAFGEEKFCYILVAELKDPPTTGIPNNEGSEASSTSTSSGLPSETMEKNERLVGYALYYYTYSTWNGRTIYVEDLFVKEGYRSKGLGTALMRECAKIGKSKDCVRMMWIVLDWNSRAIDFYERIGAAIEREWLTVKMERAALKKFATDTTPMPQ